MDQPLPDAPALPVEADVPITWTTLGFDPSTDADGNLNGTIPSGVIIFAARTPEANGALGSVCEQISTSFAFEVAGRGHFAYAVDDDISLPDTIFVPEGIAPLATGAVLALPDFAPRCAPPSPLGVWTPRSVRCSWSRVNPQPPSSPRSPARR